MYIKMNIQFVIPKQLQSKIGKFKTRKIVVCL